MKHRFYYILLVVTILSHLILYAPYVLNRHALEGAFVAVFIAAALGCINAYMLIYVYNTFKKYSLIEICKVLFGKYLGNVFSSLFILVNVLVSFFMFRGMVELVNKSMLPSTPVWAISIVMLLIYYTKLLQNNESFLHFTGFISVFIIFWYVMEIALSLKGIRFFYIRGTVIHSIMLPKAKLIVAAGFYFTGVSHLALFNPNFSKISWKKSCAIYIFVGITAALIAIYIPVGVWGPYGVKNILLQAITTADTFWVDLFFIERGLYMLIPLYFLLAATDFLLFCFVSYGLTIRMIQRKKAEQFIRIILGALYFIFSISIYSTEKLLRYGSLTISIALGYSYILAILMFIFTRLRTAKMKEGNS